jgi:hypothetical protein
VKNHNFFNQQIALISKATLLVMKLGFRRPSLKKRIAAKTSVKRYIRHSLGFKAPKGWGWLTNPKKAAYNKVYNKTTRGCLVVLVFLSGLTFVILAIILFYI